MADEKLLPEKTASHAHTTHQEPKPSLLSNVLAIVGFIILIVIVLWGLLHIATLASPWLSSLFNRTSTSVQVTAPKNATSSEAFSVSWKYSTSEKGMYGLLYPCKDTFRLETSGTGAANTIPCGAAFTVPSNEKSIVVTPRLSGTVSMSVPLSIIFIPSATSSKQAQGSATVLVHPSAARVEPAAPVTPTKPRAITPADLSVSILGANVDASGMAIVEFDIANNGGSLSGTYYFDAYLPTQSAYTYSSPAQSSLAPGDHIVNTLRFSQTVPGSISVVVDPAQTVHESNENNNYASQPLNAPYYTPQPYQYPYIY